MKFSDIDLMEVGHTIQLVGGIYHDAKRDLMFLACFPEEKIDADFDETWEPLNMTADEWSKFLLQGDVLDTHCLVKERDGRISKAILRKSQRQIDQNTSWRVYRRDGFSCRYCGAADVPLTVDHLVLWENGGPSTEENLLTACRKCNRLRGNMEFKDWLTSKEFGARAERLAVGAVLELQRILERMDKIPRVIKPRSR